jgi:hypothetical protein
MNLLLAAAVGGEKGRLAGDRTRSRRSWGRETRRIWTPSHRRWGRGPWRRAVRKGDELLSFSVRRRSRSHRRSLRRCHRRRRYHRRRCYRERGEGRRGSCRFARVARDTVHGSRVAFSKPGGTGGFGGELGGVQYRAGLTEHVKR